MNIYFRKGLFFGFLASIAMILTMFIVQITNMNPVPEPAPMAIVRAVLGIMDETPLMIVSLIAHLTYGSVAGGVYYYLLRRRGNIMLSMVYGVVLWFLMQFFWLPIAGWGLFGSDISTNVPVATLGLHLVYGIVLGIGFRTMRY